MSIDCRRNSEAKIFANELEAAKLRRIIIGNQDPHSNLVAYIHNRLLLLNTFLFIKLHNLFARALVLFKDVHVALLIIIKRKILYRRTFDMQILLELKWRIIYRAGVHFCFWAVEAFDELVEISKVANNEAEFFDDLGLWWKVLLNQFSARPIIRLHKRMNLFGITFLIYENVPLGWSLRELLAVWCPAFGVYIDNKLSTFIQLALHSDRTTHLFNNFLTNWESEACSLAISERIFI